MTMNDRPRFCQIVTAETATSAHLGSSSTESWPVRPNQ